ncbi:MAG: hypothetical protein HOF72_04390 [Planctomycetaceae bacterium]|jgi:hypothetical protein|nr:hypothetical protein [Planctomycetaceae bacterium]
MPDHEDSLGGETLDGDAKANPAEQSLGDGATMGGGVGEVVEDDKPVPDCKINARR